MTVEPESEPKTLTIEDFVEYVGFLEKQCTQENILFRGQQQDWPLLPKVARKSFTPKPMASSETVENTMLMEFRRQARPYLTLAPEAQLDWLVIAQHHGLPTRLLDWTKNPLAALWFAVRKPAVDDEPGVVWTYQFRAQHLVEDITEGFFAGSQAVVRPSHVGGRVVAQFGWFTIHDVFGGAFSPFEETDFAPFLTKVLIPASSFADIRWQLDRCGINEASLFPDLDGLCRHIEWFHTLSEDEVDADTE